MSWSRAVWAQHARLGGGSNDAYLFQEVEDEERQRGELDESEKEGRPVSEGGPTQTEQTYRDRGH